MSKHPPDAFDIIGICEKCQCEIYGKRLDDGGFVIEPCGRCLEDAFEQGYDNGYAECDEKYYLRMDTYWRLQWQEA